MIAPPTLSTLEAAALCGVDRRSMHRWVQDGRLVSYRTGGGNYRIRRDDLVAFMEDRGMPLPDDLRATPRVAIVDDDEAHCRALARRVRRQLPGAEVEVAHDGFSGGMLVADWKPDLLLLDVVMPGLDGFEVCRRIRGKPALDGVAVVVVSGSLDDAVEQRLLGLGADHCLRKPVEPARLARVLDDLNTARGAGGTS